MKTVCGDILSPNKEGKGVIVCHQVNCRGVMGAGLARQVKERFPAVYRLYKDKCLQIAHGIGGLGDTQFCTVLAEAGYIVANVFGQEGYGKGRRYTDYDALRAAFQEIARAFPAYTIRIPYLMGCGLGGGDWAEVSKIINETLVQAGVDVEIWRLPEKTAPHN